MGGWSRGKVRWWRGAGPGEESVHWGGADPRGGGAPTPLIQGTLSQQLSPLGWYPNLKKGGLSRWAYPYTVSMGVPPPPPGAELRSPLGWYPSSLDRVHHRKGAATGFCYEIKLHGSAFPSLFLTKVPKNSGYFEQKPGFGYVSPGHHWSSSL